MPLLKKKTLLAAKVETTSGTAESLTNTEGVYNAYDISCQPSIAMTDREGPGGFNYLTSIKEGQSATLTFKIDVEWDGTATEPNVFAVLMPACGWTESSNVWKPKAEAPGSNVKTVTLATYIDGKRKMICGAMGSWTLTLVVGVRITFEFTFTGKYIEPTDTSLLTPTYSTTAPLEFRSATTCAFNSVEMALQQIVFNSGNEVILLESPTDSTGYSHALVTNRRPTITANPEAVLVATQNRHNIWTTSTPYAVQVTLDGPSNSTLGITAPKAQIINIQDGDRNRVVTDEIEFLCTKNGSTQNEELYFTFTPSS